MKSIKLSYLLPLILFLSLAALLGFGLWLNPSQLPSNLIGKPAPLFTLPELKQDTDFSPSELKGRRWLLNVWASWCVSCRYEHPLLNQLSQTTDIPLVGLNYKDQKTDALQWLAQRGDPYRHIPVDFKGDVGIEWGVYGVPETFVVDENGLILYRFTGPLTADSMKTEIMPFFE